MSTDDRLVVLVKQWIRAEYQYRLGDRAYTKTAENWMLQAEECLRRAVTKKRKLSEAYEVVRD